MKAMLAMLTIVNIVLTVFGVSLALMSPMMFDGGDDGKLLWAIFWSLWIFPVVALLCVFLPWLFLWLQWFRTALVAAAVPITWMIILAVVLFAFF
jgi:hypothetical protein